jgi:hypothetical protein
MKKIFFIMVLVVFVSCKTNKTQEKEMTKEEICEFINRLNTDDQKYRGLPIMTDPFFFILDSISLADGLTKSQYAKLPTKTQLEYGKRARAIAETYPKPDKKIIDSLMNLQIELDNKNTEDLIWFMKRYGFPNQEIDGLPCKKMPGIIFRHSQEQYWDEIREVMKKSYEEGRFEKTHYGFILDHINHRKTDIDKWENLADKEMEKDSINNNIEINGETFKIGF